MNYEKRYRNLLILCIVQSIVLFASYFAMRMQNHNIKILKQRVIEYQERGDYFLNLLNQEKEESPNGIYRQSQRKVR